MKVSIYTKFLIILEKKNCLLPFINDRLLIEKIINSIQEKNKWSFFYLHLNV